MSDLDLLLQAHLERRSGRGLDHGHVGMLVRAISRRTEGVRPGSDRFRARLRLGALLPIGAAAAVAVVMVAQGLAPRLLPPGAGDPGESAVTETLQVLSRDELERVLGDHERFADDVLVAMLSFEPAPPQRGCLIVCPIATVAGASTPIGVYTDPRPVGSGPAVLHDPGYLGPVVLRVRDAQSVDFIGRLATNVGDRVVWPLPALIAEMDRAADFDYAESVVVGSLYVVEAQLFQGLAFPCPFQEPSPDALDGFRCGVPVYLAPTDADAEALLRPNQAVQPHWLRVDNFAMRRVTVQDEPDPDFQDRGPIVGYYLVRPVLRMGGFTCFMCSDGGAALLLDELRPVAIP